MSVEWNNLPLLPIRCILDHLSVANALAAMSTCRHWRQAMLLYEGRRQTLKLKAKQLEQNLFLARLFRRHTQTLHIYVNCNEEELNKFMDFVLPQFFDAIKLKEVVFIGSIYMQHNPNVPLAKLKRIITESLFIKNAPFIQRVAIFGCQLDSVNNDKDRFVHKQVEHYSNRLSFSSVTSPEDMIFSRRHVDLMTTSALKHLILEYESVTAESLATLSRLKKLTHLTLNVSYRRDMTLVPIDWLKVCAAFNTQLNVSVNVISMPANRFREVTERVFQIGMPLTSLKVMFCNTMYVPLLHQVGLMYNMTLRELVWVDCPYDGAESDRAVTCPNDDALLLADVYQQVNPFMLLCWQCAKLRRLVIHGYWLWQYDVLGLARLRELSLEVSSLFSTQTRFSRAAAAPDAALRVMLYDTPVTVDSQFIKDINGLSGCVSWRPVPWRRLPAGLRPRASRAARARYVVGELMKPWRWGVT